MTTTAKPKRKKSNKKVSPLDMKLLVIQGIRHYRGQSITIKPDDPLLTVNNEMLLTMYEFMVKTQVLEEWSHKYEFIEIKINK